jgi:hypothetical protein
MPPPDSGFPDADAGTDFDRQRRRRALARVAARLRWEPADVSAILPFDEVVAALGRRSEADLGVQTIPLDSIVGTVDRGSQTFDRAFRPATGDLRARWQRIASARRRGVPLPPIDVYRVGELHFVRDGHHRVSVARAQGDTTIDAQVREVVTAVGPGAELRLRDLPLKRHERLFGERVPLPPAARARVRLSDEWRYAQLASMVEAWGFRASHARDRLLSREEVAAAWFEEEFAPLVALIDEAGIGGPGTEAERYLRVTMLRHLLLQSQEITEDMVARMFGQARSPGADDDTMVHQILEELD